MTEEPQPSYSSGIRASDAERQRVAALLQENYAAGRLTLSELDERITASYTARTRERLAALTADLPTDPAIDPLDGTPTDPPAEPMLPVLIADPGLRCLAMWLCPPFGLAYWLLSARRNRSARSRAADPLAVSR
ncbi:MAG TPA: DUF1707 domain-containing protein [Pseudonocardiaceae bacterium]|jgi:hypothetical protein|nr:DUF1707 domain-containing protein [Pseudonocardiaceae bacterium]